MSKLSPYTLDIPRGGDFTFKPRCTATLGTDMSAWTSEFVVKDKEGSELFRKTSALVIPTPGSPHVAEATFSLTELETEKLYLGKGYAFYHVALIDAATEWKGIVLHGAIDAYVESGGAG
jgi:hypothetical protein